MVKVMMSFRIRVRARVSGRVRFRVRAKVRVMVMVRIRRFNINKYDNCSELKTRVIVILFL